MNKNNCERCYEKNEIATVTMSEAAWDRNEERHRREKKTILIALVIAMGLLAISNVFWLIHVSRTTTAPTATNTTTTNYSFPN